MNNTQVVQTGPEGSKLLSALHGCSFPKPWACKEFASLLVQPGVMAWICQDTEPSGFILVRASIDEAEILTIAVAPARRRRGLGELLINTARHALCAAGARKLFLEVSNENLAALGLYQKTGFAQLGTRASYYGGDSGAGGARKSTDAIIMGLEM
jgi:[ribosomal protein S18]-alanine N-acetyltransferase